jgi:hypothetical protein
MALPQRHARRPWAAALLLLLLASDLVAFSHAVSSHAPAAGARQGRRMHADPDADGGVHIAAGPAPTPVPSPPPPPPGNGSDPGIQWDQCDKVASVSTCGTSLLVTPDDATDFAFLQTYSAQPSYQKLVSMSNIVSVLGGQCRLRGGMGCQKEPIVLAHPTCLFLSPPPSQRTGQHGIPGSWAPALVHCRLDHRLQVRSKRFPLVQYVWGGHWGTLAA